MGLDARVYCDCLERGRLTIPAPPAVVVDENGFIGYRDGLSKEELQPYYRWYASHPCPHRNFRLIEHHLGNITGIAHVREAIAQAVKEPEQSFPIVWKRIVYSGAHGGDYLAASDVALLKREIAGLASIDYSQSEFHEETSPGIVLTRKASPDEIAFIKTFFVKLQELVDASLKIGKPIAF